MFCKKCGTKIEDGNNFCTNCGNPIKEDNNNPQKVVENANKEQSIVENDNEDYSTARILCILSVVLTFFSTGIMAFLSTVLKPLATLIESLAGLCPLAGIILLIIARVKYPKYKPGKIIMWVYIGTLVAGIIGFILLVALCYLMCSNINTSGC